jgi:protein gp37
VSDRSAIEWTDATWNPVRGCTKVSPGCRFCYAELFAVTAPAFSYLRPGAHHGDVRRRGTCQDLEETTDTDGNPISLRRPDWSERAPLRITEQS